MVKAKLETPEFVMFAKAGLDIILENPNTVFTKLTAKQLLYEGFDINCNSSEFPSKGVCSAVSQNSRVWKVSDKHLKFSYFHPVS